MYRPAPQSRTAQKWNEKKEKLLIEFTDLREEDLVFETGRKREMIQKIGFKLGKTEEEMDNIIQSI